MEAAQIFEQECGTSPGINLSAITDRTEIRKAVQSGKVEEAIERVNDLNPEVCRHATSICQAHVLPVGGHLYAFSLNATQSLLDSALTPALVTRSSRFTRSCPFTSSSSGS